MQRLQDQSQMDMSGERHIAALLANSRGCSRHRVQAGYNYTIADGWQGRWRLPLRVIGDKKGGNTARLFAADPHGARNALNRFRGCVSHVLLSRDFFPELLSALATSWRPSPHPLLPVLINLQPVSSSRIIIDHLNDVFASPTSRSHCEGTARSPSSSCA